MPLAHRREETSSRVRWTNPLNGRAVVPTCLIVQHVEPEGPGAIADALEAARIDVSTCHVHLGAPIPGEVGDFDGLVVMGGPMSAVNDQGFASRRAEIELLTQALRLGVPVLGVCLGAQLLALAAGASVLSGANGLEVGWGPVQLSAAADQDRLFAGLPPELTVLHWHGDTFDLPPNAVRLASSPRYREQAFRIGDRAWGLQFHVEVSASSVDSFLGAFGDDVLAAGTTPEAVAAATATALRDLTPHREHILDRFAAVVAAGRLTRTADLVDRF